MKIAAGVVLYNPDIIRFDKCLHTIIQQFDMVFLFDNVGDMGRYTDFCPQVKYITESKNRGIAYGLNKIMEEADNLGYDWVVTLDQDTMLPNNMLKEYIKYVDINNVAIICPQVIDKRRAYMTLVDTEEAFIEVRDHCITSGSCTNVKVWRELGGFDEWLFIDFVDNDFCKKVIINGYRILKITKIIIDQEFGKIRKKSNKKVQFYLWLSDFLHNKNIAKLSYKKTVSPIRVYYVHRNLIYLNKKYKFYGGIGYDNFNCNSFIGFLFYFSLPSFLRGSAKMRIFKGIIKGLWDGVRSNPKVYSANLYYND